MPLANVLVSKYVHASSRRTRHPCSWNRRGEIRSVMGAPYQPTVCGVGAVRANDYARRKGQTAHGAEVHRGKGTAMKAIVQDEYGKADVLKFEDVEKPAVGENDVLVRVHAAGSGPDVWHLMTGKPYMARPMIGFRRPKVRVRGWDVAGTVEAVGAGVTGFKPGGDVMGFASSGSFAEFAVVPVNKLAMKPARLSFEEAAAVPIAGTTGFRAVREAADVKPGQKVLVVGAAGGVGSFAVQCAKAFGAEVTGVASTSKLDLVRSLGADDVIDYTRQDFTAGARRWEPRRLPRS